MAAQGLVAVSIPDLTTLVDCSLDMLHQNSSGRRDLVHRVFVWKVFPSCIVHLGAGTGSIKSMTNFLVMFIALSGISVRPFASISSASVSFGSDFHINHAVFFSCPAKCRSLSKQGTLHGLPGSNIFYLFQMLATVHIQVVDHLWQTQTRPQHQCDQCE